MEPWTDSGAHRICCIPCGHVYGRSCLETWLSRDRSTSAKCPQCGKRFALEHIINLYAPGNLWDRYTTSCHIQAPVTSEQSGFPSDLCKQVLDVLQEPANIEKEYGVHVNEIVKRFKLPESNIKQAIYSLVECGEVYTTIDDFHFKAVFGEWLPSVQIGLPFQAPVTGLLKEVLDILHEPANIEKEHGVHVAEIVKRLRQPESDIWVAMGQLIDMGFIYYTIDESHFRSLGGIE